MNRKLKKILQNKYKKINKIWKTILELALNSI